MKSRELQLARAEGQLAEARLQALNAQIRPHFLFKSINAVLALMRRDPKRAERTLEDLADLFRSLRCITNSYFVACCTGNQPDWRLSEFCPGK